METAAKPAVDAPADGIGSTASAGQRVLGFAADALLSALVASIFTAPSLPRNLSVVVLGLEYLVFTGFFGQTPGMRIVGIRLARIDDASMIGLPRAFVRTVLLLALVPAVIWNSQGRGLHDRAAGVAVVRSRA
ncbi:MAG: RDD family protein [Mycobacteriales bacterium]